MDEIEAPPKTGTLTKNAIGFFSRSKAQALFDELRGGGPERLKPRVTVGIVFAHIIAILIHLVSASLFIGGLFLIVWTWPAWLGVTLGIALTTAGWFLLPRFGNLPDDTVPREQAPALYTLTDEIAASLDTPPIDVIALSPDPNASFDRVGLRGTSVLTLGLPLWRILPPQERVALIAHELAHQENGDTGRRFLITHALTALYGWHDVLTQPPQGERSFMDILIQGFTEFFALIVEGIASTLLRLFWSESHRAEYLADYLGSRVSGTRAFIETNNRLLHLAAYPEALFDATMKTPARNPDYAAIFDRFTRLLDEVSPERIAAAEARADHHQQDVTHPPTAWRSDLLNGFPTDPKVTLDPQTSDTIDAELAPFADRLGLQLVRRWAYSFK